MGLRIELGALASIVLFCGHLLVAFSYLGIAWVLQAFVASLGNTAKIIAYMFRLFSYFIFACGVQHLFAAMLFLYPLWASYVASVWITGVLALFTLGFIWRLRPQFPVASKEAPIVVVQS